MSLPTTFNTVNEQGGISVEHTFDTKPENMYMLYYIVRNQLYSDEISALLREYSVNSTDVHIQTGQTDRPILVTLPTQLDSFLKIRDYGTGLDESGIKEYVSFGESSKRADPNQTGQLGIGCKCGFTYGDSFLVNSYQNGMLTSWSAYIDPSNKGKIALMATCETTEPNGIEVVIPIRANDVSKVHEKAIFLYSFFKVTPQLVNATREDMLQLESYKNAKPVFQGEGWRYMGSGKSYAVMGNIPYSIDSSNFTDTELRAETKKLLEGGLIINFELGRVDFSASREQLKYTPLTKKNISAKLTDITNELTKQCSLTFDACKSVWDAKILYKKVFSLYGEFFHLRNLFGRSVTYKGFPIGTDAFSLEDVNGGATAMRYRRPGSGGMLIKERVYNLHAADNHVVVLNDAGLSNGILNRIVGLIECSGSYDKEVYLISFTDDEAKKKWFAESGLDCPILLLSSLPKEPLSKYYNNPTVANGGKNVKHASKEFVYNGNGKSRYSSQRSAFWDVATVDLSNDTGVYVGVDRFYTLSKNGGGQHHPHELNKTLQTLVGAGIVPPVIYGFKEASVAKAKNNPNMVHFDDWVRIAVEECISNQPLVEQKIANRRYVNNELSPVVHLIRRLKDANEQWSLQNDHPFLSLIKRFDELTSYNLTDIAPIEAAMYLVGRKCTKTVQYDLLPEFGVLKDKYPLLFAVLRSEGTSLTRELEEYVGFIDGKDSESKTIS